MTKTNLLRSLVNVSGMTLISRIVGFFRDMLMAQFFGAGLVTDAFFVAFRLPNLLRRVFAEGAFSQAFVPILAEYKAQKTATETRNFIASVAGLLSLVLIMVTLLGIIFAGSIVMLTAPGFNHDPQKFTLTVKLLRITFPYILLISLASLVSGVLNTWGKFSIPAFTPTILNLTWIIFILLLRHYFNPPIVAIAWAVFIGGILQLSFQLPYLKSLGLPILPKLDLKNSAVWRVVRLMVPAIFAMSISQISLVINTIFASFLPRGSISWMYYADRMMEFPTGVLGVALGTILLPSLSRHASNKNIVEFSKTLDWGIRLCLLLALPATVGLAIIAKPLTMTLFMHGKLFTLFDVRMTQQALVAYAVGLLGLILVKILAPGFYANQNISTPVKIAIFVLICTQLMNLVFIGPLKHAGLALSIGLGAWINAICLAYLLIKRGIYIPQTGWVAFIRKLMLAISGMVVMLVLSLRLLPLDFAGHTYVRIISLLTLLTIAVTSYFASLFMLGFRTHQFSFKTLG